jgi:S1-C subfamily serine protease
MTAILPACRRAALVAFLAPLAVVSALAQGVAPMPPLSPEAPMAPRFYVTGSGFTNRAYLGITPRSSTGASDTLGLLVDDVETARPADKAGIRRGSRLVSVDGIDLRVEPRDLGDDAAESLPESRLRRLLSRKRAGDTVSVVVLTDGRKDTRRVVLAESPFATSLRAMTTGRRVLGIAFAQRGSIRDTAGLLVVSVSSGGAADNAGLNEGDRIVSIDGVDLRVPAADAGNSDGVSARVSRFRRALDAARDSQPVKLEVLSDSRRRTISVVPVIERGFAFSTNGFAGMAAGIRASVRRDFDRSLDRDDDGNDDRAEERADAARERAEARAEALRERAEGQRERQRDMAEAQREVQREMSQLQRDLAREGRDRGDDRGNSWSRSDDASRSRGSMHGRTDGATLAMGGLSLASVDRDFAQRFGQGSENGALVVRVRGDWEPLKPGDVLLTIDGRSVRDGTSLDVTIDRRRDERLEVLRNGKRETLTLPAVR